MQKLIADAQAGNRMSMEELISKFHPLIKKYARKLNYEDSESDLVLFFIELIKSFPKGLLEAANEGKIVKYISVSIKNQYNHLVKDHIFRKNEICLSQLSEEQNYYLESRLASENEQPSEMTFSGISSILSPREFQIITLIYYLGYSASEIARKESCSRQAVNQIKKRALKKIQKQMFDMDKNCP